MPSLGVFPLGIADAPGGVASWELDGPAAIGRALAGRDQTIVSAVNSMAVRAASVTLPVSDG